MLEKFGEELSHRDYLGALMNLGIERSTLGDIVMIGKHAYLFCTDKMAPYIIENLSQISIHMSNASMLPRYRRVSLPSWRDEAL